VHTQTIAEAPLNRRGGQESYLMLAKGQFGSRHLAITWVEGPPGSEQRRHTHAHEEQVYVIVRGHGEMHVGDETQRVYAGMLVFVPPGSAHSIRNLGDEPLVYVSATAPPFDAPDLGSDFAYEPALRSVHEGPLPLDHAGEKQPGHGDDEDDRD
jgi:mannose-6-phosphate isomerase-like protein (cupin superfamily)